MLAAIARALQSAVLGLVGYNLVTALWGWHAPDPPPPGARRRRFRVVIPAHDEAAVIGNLLADLAAQDYPPELTDVRVLADRCRDDTAAIARRSATVHERAEGPGGKGALLGWHLDAHPLSSGEALVVLDADNRVPAGMLARFADELDGGGSVLQAYLDVANPDASPLATAAALSYWASNRMVQLARRNLGWSADLGGTGMCLTETALTAAGGFGDSLTEDADLAVRLVLAGHRVLWLHDVRVRDEKPARLDVTVRQRARWMAGRRAVARRHAAALVRRAAAERSLTLFDQAVRITQPGRALVALACAGGAGAAAAFPGRWLLPWPLWAGAAGVQLLAPLPFLARDRVPARYLWRYPLLAIFAALWGPIRFVASRSRGWYHTPHEG